MKVGLLCFAMLGVYGLDELDFHETDEDLNVEPVDYETVGSGNGNQLEYYEYEYNDDDDNGEYNDSAENGYEYYELETNSNPNPYKNLASYRRDWENNYKQFRGSKYGEDVELVPLASEGDGLSRFNRIERAIDASTSGTYLSSDINFGLVDEAEREGDDVNSTNSGEEDIEMEIMEAKPDVGYMDSGGPGSEAIQRENRTYYEKEKARQEKERAEKKLKKAEEKVERERLGLSSGFVNTPSITLMGVTIAIGASVALT